MRSDDISANFALAVGQWIGDNVLGRAEPKQEKVALVTLAAPELLIRGVKSIKNAENAINLIETERKRKETFHHTLLTTTPSEFFSQVKKKRDNITEKVTYMCNRQLRLSSSIHGPAVHYTMRMFT